MANATKNALKQDAPDAMPRSRARTGNAPRRHEDVLMREDATGSPTRMPSRPRARKHETGMPRHERMRGATNEDPDGRTRG